MDWKQLGKAALGGSITAILGNYLLPVANSLLTFIPQKTFFLGVTPHSVVAYGIAFWAAMLANEKVLK